MLNVVLYPLAIIFLLLRVYTRLRITKGFGLDDVFILFAIVPATAFFVVALLVDKNINLFLHAVCLFLSSVPVLALDRLEQMYLLLYIV